MNPSFDNFLVRDGEKPLYIQIYEHIKASIENGSISDGEKLPAIRILSNHLEVNTSTVISAYNLLDRDSLIYKRVGSGTFVRAPEKPQSPFKGFHPYIGKSLSSDMDLYGVSKTSRIIDFRKNVIPESSFPVESFKEALDIVIQRDKGGAFSYEDPSGYEPLRQSLAEHLKTSAGILVNAEDILILSGDQQGLDLLANTLISLGDSVVTEAPSYMGANASFLNRGASIVEVPVDSEGMDFGLLKREVLVDTPRLVYTTPNCQYPTGIVYSDERRRAILDLAQKHGFYIIEDDHLGELSHASRKGKTLKSMDYNDNVIYIKSFSKTVMPGIRLALMIAPSRVRKEILRAKSLSDLSGAGLTQRAFDLMLRNGLYEVQIKKLKSEFKWKRKLTKQTISRYLSDSCEFFDSVAGLSYWMKLKHSNSSRKLAQEALKRGVYISTGDMFSYSKRHNPFFRVGVYGVGDDDIVDGISILSELLI